MPTRTLPTISHRLAERHEALWLRMTALHKDVATLAARRPTAAVGETTRITAEGLLSDCVAFAPGRTGKLPVAAADLGGLVVQLGQALAMLDAFEAGHSDWNGKRNARFWRVATSERPIGRLRQEVGPPPDHL